MGKININYQNGAIGGVLPSTDFISAFMFDSTQLPSGFTNTQRVKQVYSLKDAVNLGITNTSIGETKATGGKVVVNTIGAVGDLVSIYVEPLNYAKTLLGTATVVTGDDTASITTKLIDAINLNVAKTGWIAGGTSGVSLTPPTGLGAAINGASVITVEKTSGSTFATTVTNFSTGAGSEIDLMYYTIDAYFKANPNGKAYVGVFDFTAAYDSTKIVTMQTYASGEIRQMGILLKAGLDDAVDIISATQVTLNDQASKHKPLSVTFGFQAGTFTTVSELINLRTLTSPNVSVTISNAYGTGAKGYNLIGSTGLAPTDLGELLGHESRSKVSESIAWVEKHLTAYNDIMLVTGETWLDIEDTTIPEELFNKGYIFERKYIGYAGSYFDNDSVADAFTSDYDSIHRRRTIDKAARLIYTALVPFTSSPLELNATTGQLSAGTILTLENTCSKQLDVMYSSSEISGFAVTIDPTQNVLATKNLDITVQIVPIGTADEITVNLQYALSI